MQGYLVRYPLRLKIFLFPPPSVSYSAHPDLLRPKNFVRSLCYASLLPAPDPVRKILAPCSFTSPPKNPTSLHSPVATQTHSHLFSARGRQLCRFTTLIWPGSLEPVPVHHRLITSSCTSFTLCPSTNAHTHPTTAPAGKTASRHRTFATSSTFSESVPAFFLLCFLFHASHPLEEISITPTSSPKHSDTQTTTSPISITHTLTTHRDIYIPVSPQTYIQQPNQHSNPLTSSYRRSQAQQPNKKKKQSFDQVPVIYIYIHPLAPAHSLSLHHHHHF